MSLLPSKPDTTAAEDGEPRVVGVDSDDADELLGALSSDTARELLGALHDDPAPPGELADRVDTSLQNAQYHLEKLENAGAVEVVDTAYSEKGREMDVYAPADQPLVICAGDRSVTTSLRSALTRLLGGLGLVGLGSLVVQSVFGGGLGAVLGDGGDGVGGVAGTPTRAAAPAKTATPTPVPQGSSTPGAAGTPTETATEAVDTVTTAASGGTDAAAASLPPGLLFFLGGATVLLAGFVVWYARQ